MNDSKTLAPPRRIVMLIGKDKGASGKSIPTIAAPSKSGRHFAAARPNLLPDRA